MASSSVCGILPATFWHAMLMLFSRVYLMFPLLFRDDGARLVVALNQQVLVRQRHLGKRLRW